MADITLEERVAYLESLLAARSIEPEDTTTIDELDPVASVYNEDLILVKQNGDEKKATVQNVKDNVMTDVDTKLDNYSTTEEMNEAIEASSPKVSQEPGNVVEMKTDGLFVSEDISGKVESFTQEQYNNLTEAEKNNGQIREITNTNPKKVMLNGMNLFLMLDDTKITTGNVLSAAKTKAEIDAKHKYSTEEKVIGEWIDGKPIYRKVLNINAVNISDWAHIPEMDNLNIKKIIKDLVMGTDSTCTDCIAFPYARRYPNGKFKFTTNGWIFVVTTIILEYTKTTD